MLSADEINNWFLHNVTIPAVGNGETEGRQLEKYARKVFGKKFRGVFMIDEIPTDLSPECPYAIFNMSPSTHKTGTHWIAAAYQEPENLLVYDSLSCMQKTPKRLLQKYPLSEITDPDCEQSKTEDNCGARVLAWLMVAEVFPDQAADV